ncbi:hypothetical protein DFJ74DRAFT_752058 [Hyaloraphidium curvatum]|nr:hypothetical protein DFJ74DRAFT_752058 [Hyaloraphidium curvatum]
MADNAGPVAELEEPEVTCTFPPEVLGLVAWDLDFDTLKEFALANKTCLQLALPRLYLFAPPIDSESYVVSQKACRLLLEDPLDTGKLRYLKFLKLNATGYVAPQESLEPKLLEAVVPNLVLMNIDVSCSSLSQACLTLLERAPKLLNLMIRVFPPDEPDSWTNLSFVLPSGISSVHLEFQEEVQAPTVRSVWRSLSEAHSLDDLTLEWVVDCRIPELNLMPTSAVQVLRRLSVDIRDLSFFLTLEPPKLVVLTLNLGATAGAEEMLHESWPAMCSLKSLRALQLDNASTREWFFRGLWDSLEILLLKYPTPGLGEEGVDTVVSNIRQGLTKLKFALVKADPDEWMIDEADSELEMWTELGAIAFEEEDEGSEDNASVEGGEEDANGGAGEGDGTGVSGAGEGS